MRRWFWRGVGSVLDLWPAPRTVDEILAHLDRALASAR